MLATIIGNGKKEERLESGGEVGSFKDDLVIRKLRGRVTLSRFGKRSFGVVFRGQKSSTSF